MGSKFTEWFGSILFAIVGAIFIVAGLNIFISSIEFKKVAVEGTAIITNIQEYRDSDGDISYKVFVKYTVDGTEYNKQLNVYSIDMTVGKEIVIYYNPASPTVIQTSGQDSIGLIFAGIGLLTFVIGSIMMIIKIKRITNKKRLLTNGKRVDATIEEVVYNTAYSVNHRSPYFITCKLIDSVTGETYLIKSENIWYNPQSVIDERKITTLPVYIDINNPKIYYIALDEISKKVIDLR